MGSWCLFGIVGDFEAPLWHLRRHFWNLEHMLMSLWYFGGLRGSSLALLGAILAPVGVRFGVFFVLAHVDAQRVKTRGPNPNPTARAQSKRCLPLSTKTQNIIKILPPGLPNPILFGTFFEVFRRRCLKDPRPCPKAQKRHQDGGQRVPKWRPGVPNWSPEVPRSTRRTPTCAPNSKNVGAGATMELQGHSQCQKDITGPPKVVLMH